MTKPSRWRWKGRYACEGSPVQRDIVCSLSKALKIIGANGASAAPAMTTSAEPYWMSRSASPSAALPAAQVLALVLALQPELNGQVSMCAAGENLHAERGGDAFDTALHEYRVLLLAIGEAAESRAVTDARKRIRLVRTQVDARILNRHARSSDGELGATVHALQPMRSDPGPRPPVLNEGRVLRAQGLRVELREPDAPALRRACKPFQNSLRPSPRADDQAHAGDNGAARGVGGRSVAQ